MGSFMLVWRTYSLLVAYVVTGALITIGVAVAFPYDPGVPATTHVETRVIEVPSPTYTVPDEPRITPTMTTTTTITESSLDETPTTAPEPSVPTPAPTSTLTPPGPTPPAPTPRNPAKGLTDVCVVERRPGVFFRIPCHAQSDDRGFETAIGLTAAAAAVAIAVPTALLTRRKFAQH